MNEVIVVTGASAGLGRAIVRRFARDGSAIGLIARGRERLEQTLVEVESLGGRGLVLPLDVADADAVEEAAARVETELGPIDVWINNAMVSVYSPIKQMTADEFRRVTEVTYLGYVHGTLAALKRMLPRDRGVIIQVGSALAHRSIPLQSAYCASKHAIMGFHESLLSELIHDKSKVRTTMVQMPAMNTPQFDWAKSRLPRQPQPVPPIYQPEVGADAVHHAVRHDVGREFLVSWSTIKAVVGEKLVPP
jgi:NAD(P)-dependent dehydrogenase (short-subunit alcohol dehydrogenase family)